MIYFFADNHYGANPGKVIFENLPETLRDRIFFAEDDWSMLESGAWLENCSLLVLNMIGDTCNIPHPGAGAEKAVRAWCEKGGNILLLHGSSAAFWQWEWWRKIVGFRWVRPNDPDGVAESVHPKAPYQVVKCNVRHPLISALQELDLPEDEIYTRLEQVSPTVTLMECAAADWVYPQCCETISPWGGKIVSFIPGHRREVTANPEYINNINVLIKYLEN